MNRDDIERLWFQAMRESTEANEPYIRHRFAALVAAAEREACAKVCDKRADDYRMGFEEKYEAQACAYDIRARSEG